MNRQLTTFQDMVLDDETPRPEGTKIMTGEELRLIGSEPKGSSIDENFRYKRKDQSFLKTHKIGT